MEGRIEVIPVVSRSSSLLQLRWFLRFPDQFTELNTWKSGFNEEYLVQFVLDTSPTDGYCLSQAR